MHLFLVCTKLYKLELIQTQVKAEVNNTDITDESMIRHMNVEWRIESGGEGVTQVREDEVALMNSKFKGKCRTCRKYGQKQNKCSQKNKSKEEKGNKKFLGQ